MKCEVHKDKHITAFGGQMKGAEKFKKDRYVGMFIQSLIQTVK